ncbi:MAG: SDR family oxidoreductase [Pseudolabrys sp.]|nr:SDR family oxidoreductase [Pseudolabrys sp.]
MAATSASSRIAIVTGAARGIGRATALRLCAGGWTIAAIDQSPMADLSEAERGLHEFRCDLTDSAAMKNVVAQTLERFDRIDLLVNNAGISGAKPVHETDDENLARIMEVNFAVPFRLSREVLQVMQPGSSIINVASVVNFRATPSTSTYTASKAALAGLTRQMASEYGPRGIRCNAVAPGLVETNLTSDKLRNDPKFRRIWVDGTPWHRLGRPEDIAAAIAFLASPDAEFINGHTLVIDGGWSVAAPAV